MRHKRTHRVNEAVQEQRVRVVLLAVVHLDQHADAQLDIGLTVLLRANAHRLDTAIGANLLKDVSATTTKAARGVIQEESDLLTSRACLQESASSPTRATSPDHKSALCETGANRTSS